MNGLVITGIVLSYGAMGLLTAKIGYNVALNSAYDRLEGIYTNSWRSKAEAAEITLDRAKDSVDSIDGPFIWVLGFGLWPIYLPFMCFWLLVKKVSKINFMQSRAEKQVKAVRAEQNLKADYEKALKILQQSGIDTTELRNLEN